MRIILLIIFISLSGCLSKDGGLISDKFSSEYEDVLLKDVVENPNKYIGVKIRVIGIYLGDGDSLLFSDSYSFETRDRKRAIFVDADNHSLPKERSNFPVIGRAAVAEGVFYEIPSEYIKLYVGELRHVRLLQSKKE